MATVAGIVVVVGVVASALAWRLVARGRDVWRTLPPLLAFLGAGSLLLLPSLAAPAPGSGRDIAVAVRLGLGLLTGAGLFVATRLFVAVAGRFRVFAAAMHDAYGRAESVAVSVAIILSIVAALGEEVFWRGLVYRVGVDRGLSLGAAAAVGVALYVLANAPSRLLPIIVGAAVGGALWAALAWWTGGILAPIASHMLWTGLMLGFPPGPPRAEVT
jgi:uncharacterized protein